MGIDINRTSLYMLLFADDQILVAGDEKDADYMMTKLPEVYNMAGLKANSTKTKYMVISGQWTLRTSRSLKFTSNVNIQG